MVGGPVEHDDEDPNSVVNPTLLVEVLSDSTEAYDRGAKFAHYRTLPSLAAVLFVRHREPGLELFVKNDDGSWRLEEARLGDVLSLPGLDGALDVNQIYRGPLPD